MKEIFNDNGNAILADARMATISLLVYQLTNIAGAGKNDSLSRKELNNHAENGNHHAHANINEYKSFDKL